MSFTHTVQKTLESSAGRIEASVAKSSGQVIAIDETVTTTATINLDIIVDKLQAVFILADGDCSAVFTYSDASTSTITLTGNLALDWQISGYFTVPLTAGKTTTQVVVTESVTGSVQFQLHALVDPT